MEMVGSAMLSLLGGDAMATSDPASWDTLKTLRWRPVDARLFPGVAIGPCKPQLGDEG